MLRVERERQERRPEIPVEPLEVDQVAEVEVRVLAVVRPSDAPGEERPVRVRGEEVGLPREVAHGVSLAHALERDPLAPEEGYLPLGLELRLPALVLLLHSKTRPSGRPAAGDVVFYGLREPRGHDSAHEVHAHLLAVGERVRVDVEGHRGVGVAEDGAHGLHVHAGADRHRREGVPEVVEPRRLPLGAHEPRHPHERPPLLPERHRALPGAGDGVPHDEESLVPVEAHGLALAVRRACPRLQHAGKLVAVGDGPGRAPRLRGGERERAVRPREGVRDADLAGHAVDVLPPEGAYLPLPHPRHEREEHCGRERVGDASQHLVELTDACGVEGVYRLRGPLGRVDEVEGVGGYVAQLARPDEGGLEEHVGVRDRVPAVAVLHHVALELLDLPRGDLPHGGLAELGAQEVPRVPAVAVGRGGEDVAGGLLQVYVVEDVAVDGRLAGDGAGELLVLPYLLVAPLPQELLGDAPAAVVPPHLPVPADLVLVARHLGGAGHFVLPAIVVLPADREAPLPEPLVLVHVASAELPRHRSSQILEPSARGGGALAGHKGHT